ncbi:MAG TPA: universal stress protein, partial [Planctomycetota bacterium]|nr:universal stress protein [Planctomycetota bacterium]
LDGSKDSESVLPHLETLLESQDADVTLVHVISDLEVSKIQGTRAYLTAAAKELQAKGVVIDVHVLVGRPAPMIVRMAVQGGYSLILMCSKGKKGLSRLVLGSVTEEVLRRSPLPVLVVHPLGTSKRKLRLKRIVVALDGSHRSASILPYLAPLAKATGSKLLFMTAVDPLAKNDMPVEVVSNNLFREQKLMHRQGIKTELAIRYGDPATEILAFSDVQDADLLAIATHGRTGVDRMVYGSVAESVLRSGELPMLVLRTAGTFKSDPLHAPAIRAQRAKESKAIVGT